MSGKARSRWSAVDAARGSVSGTLRASYSSLSNALGASGGLSERMSAPRDISMPSLPTVGLPAVSGLVARYRPSSDASSTSTEEIMVDSSTGQFPAFNEASPSEGDHHGSSESALQKFLCPCCQTVFLEPGVLVAHFNAEHTMNTNEDEEYEEKVGSGSEAAAPGPTTKDAASASSSSSTAAAAKTSDEVAPGALACFCGVPLPSKQSSSWPIAILGSNPLTWQSGMAPPTCAHCYQPLCAAHAQEHTWPNNDACRPAFVTTAAATVKVSSPGSSPSSSESSTTTTTLPAAKGGTGGFLSTSTATSKKKKWVCEPCIALLHFLACKERQGWWRARVEAVVNGEWVDRKTYVWYHARRVVEDSALAKAGRVAEVRKTIEMYERNGNISPFFFSMMPGLKAIGIRPQTARFNIY